MAAPCRLVVVVIACCLGACSFKGSPQASTPHAGASPNVARRAIVVDDQTIGSSVDRFSYKGKWERIRARNDGRYAGTSTRCYAPGGSFSIFFFGRRFELHGVVGPNGGPATLVLDGKIYQITFRSQRKRFAMVFLSPTLSEGPHSIVGVVGVKDKNVAPNGYVNIDYARIQV